MKKWINLIVVIAGIILLLSTIYIDSLSENQCAVLGIAGFLLIFMGWMTSCTSD